MLYTKKDIEKLIADLVAKFIIEHGARVCMDDNNYSNSVHDIHINLLLDNNHKIIVYKTQDEWDGLHIYDCGMCSIGTIEYKPTQIGKRTVYKDEDSFNHQMLYLYHYKNVFTDSLAEYELMKSKGDNRFYNKPSEKIGYGSIKYNPDAVLKVLKHHRGYKRLKAKDIIRVDKVYRYGRKQYKILVVDKEPITVYFKN